MQLMNSLEKVLVFFNWVRKRIVTTGGMLERRRVLIVENPVINSLSLYQSIRSIGPSLPSLLSLLVSGIFMLYLLIRFFLATVSFKIPIKSQCCC